MRGTALVGYLLLPSSPTAPELARQFLVQTQCAARSSAQRDDAARVVTELVSKALRRVEPPVVLRVECRRGELVLQVGGTSWGSLVAARDAGEAVPDSRVAALNDALGSYWKVTQYDDGHSLWARLDRPIGPPERARSCARATRLHVWICSTRHRCHDWPVDDQGPGPGTVGRIGRPLVARTHDARRGRAQGGHAGFLQAAQLAHASGG